MNNNPRYFRAVLTAPLAVIPVIFMQMIVALLLESDKSWFYAPDAKALLGALAGLLIYLTYALVIAYIATVVLGLPVYWLLRRYGKASVLHCTVAGGILGLLMGSTFILVPIFAIAITICGAAVAAAFCRIAGRPGSG